jgi:crossover junction endodeoxyribonuclease RuvC
MTRILGIDPGSLITGYGVIDIDGRRSVHVASGCFELHGDELPVRLKRIFDGLREVVRSHRPDEMAIEQVFMHRNADSALKLGQARGAAICAGMDLALPVFEYSARQVKQAIVGRGGAAKTQVQHMVRILLSLTSIPQADTADALAVALCHGHTRGTLEHLPAVRGMRRGRLR